METSNIRSTETTSRVAFTLVELLVVIAIVAGYFPCAAFPGWNPWFSLVLGAALVVVCVVVLGKHVGRPAEPSAGEHEASPEPEALSRTA